MKNLRSFLKSTNKTVASAKKEVKRAGRILGKKKSKPKKKSKKTVKRRKLNKGKKSYRRSLGKTLAKGGLTIKKGTKQNKYDYLMVYVTRRYSKKQLRALSKSLKKN